MLLVTKPFLSSLTSIAWTDNNKNIFFYVPQIKGVQEGACEI